MALSKDLPGRRTKRISRKNNFLFAQTRIVPIDSLSPHPDNPNIGDVEVIRESLRMHGMYRPVVVNTRNGLIAAGHHTWLAARAEGWSQIGVVEIDVSDDDHMRIMLADNETAKKAVYDEAILDRILQGLNDVRGTGFTPLDVEDVHARAMQMAGSALNSLEQRHRVGDATGHHEPGTATFGEDDPDEDDPDEDGADAAGDAEPGRVDIDTAPDVLPGALTLKSPDDMQFERIGYWGIPKLRTDMLMRFDELPQNLETWAGSATKDWPDPDTWWLYNYGVDSTSGMRDLSKIVLSFYCWDDYFEKWWHETEKYAARALNSGIKYAVAPNFSQWPEDPHATNLWNLYRSRLIARYLQEVGIRVVPDVNWPYRDDEFLTKYVLATLPEKLPMIAFQMQTYHAKDMTTAEQDHLRKLIQLVFDTLRPQGLLLYAGRPGQEFFRRFIHPGCPVRVLGTRTNKLSEKAKQRERKTTL